MDRRDTARPLHDPLARAHRATRDALRLRHILRATAACAALVALATTVGLLVPTTPATATTRLVLLALACSAVLAHRVRALQREQQPWDVWLEHLEHRFPTLRSWLRNALELESRPLAPGATSPELAAALRDEAARRLASVPLAQERPRVAPGPALLTLGGSAALILALALVWPQAAGRAWRTLWDPGAAAPPVTLHVEPGPVTLTPGATLTVHARIEGTTATPRLLGPGAAPEAHLERSEHGVRTWRFDLPPVTTARTYAVRVQRVESPRYRIALSGAPQPVSFTFETHAPAYARLPVQTGNSTSGDLAALRGSRVRVEALFDRDLEELRTDGRAWHAVTPRRWQGEIAIDHDGAYTLAGRSAEGAGTWRYRITALPDAPPVLTVTVPTGDQDLPTGQQVPFDVQAQDDLGLTSLTLQWRKDATQPWRDVPLARFADEPREARIAARWDASVLALVPGETASLRFEVRDNDRIAGPGRATSNEFHLRFPSLAELYQSLDQHQEQVTRTLEQAREQAREVQRSLDQIQRQQPARGTQATPQFERSEEMKKASDRTSDVSKRIDEAAQRMKDHLVDSAERQAYREELQQKMREMSQLLQQIQSRDFKDALQRMQKAVEQLDRREMDQTLPQLRQENQDLLKNLERSLALLKQLQQQEKLDALGTRAEELKARQDELNRQHAEAAKTHSADAKAAQARATQQQEAAARTEQLASDVQQAAQQAEDTESRKALEQAAQDLRQQAEAPQQAAAQQSAQQQDAQAAKSGQQASAALQQAASQLGRQSQQAQNQRDSADLAAVRRSAQDLVSLSREAQRSAQAQQSSQSSGDKRELQDQADRQSDLADGVSRVADSLAALSEKTPFLNPSISRSLGKAMQGLQQSSRELSQGNRARGQMQGQDAAARLNEAVNALRDAEQSMCSKPGQGPMGKGAGEKLGPMGQRQSQLNQRGRELAQRLTQQMRISAGDRAEMRALADAQRRLREELEQVQRDEQRHPSLLGRLDQARRDMKDAEDALEKGDVGPDLQDRQQRILSRLLDAQRSVNRRDLDPQREAELARDLAHPSPGALPAEALRENDRLRLDLLKAAADRYPAQYRAFIQRYLEALNRSHP